MILYIVATPIGNLEDISLRALRVLKEVDLIAAEDTRHTQNLLSHYDIRTPLTSYHEHNEKAQAAKLVEKLRRGENIALVSDAGTPAISDPGYRLVVEALRSWRSGDPTTRSLGGRNGFKRQRFADRSFRLSRAFCRRRNKNEKPD